MEKFVGSIFDKKEILRVENFYTFIEKKKIVTFIPLKNVDVLTAEMSRAGGGLIGNYKMCSFRTKGVGTFKPTSKANPVSGIKNRLSYEDEIKLEMECNAPDINKVIDALLENHPYDEVAYEIYNFKKRDKKAIGIIVELKARIFLQELIKRLNKKLELDLHKDRHNLKFEIKRIAFLHSGKIRDNVMKSLEWVECNCIIRKFKNNINLYILNDGKYY